jgi:hypothetical protein
MKVNVIKQDYSIKADWEKFEQVVIAKGTPIKAIEVVRSAYYAGATHIMNVQMILSLLVGSEDLTPGEAQNIINRLKAEADTFYSAEGSEK